jgi:hypothetical protein
VFSLDYGILRDSFQGQALYTVACVVQFIAVEDTCFVLLRYDCNMIRFVETYSVTGLPTVDCK